MIGFYGNGSCGSKSYTGANRNVSYIIYKDAAHSVRKQVVYIFEDEYGEMHFHEGSNMQFEPDLKN